MFRSIIVFVIFIVSAQAIDIPGLRRFRQKTILEVDNVKVASPYEVMSSFWEVDGIASHSNNEKQITPNSVIKIPTNDLLFRELEHLMSMSLSMSM